MRARPVFFVGLFLLARLLGGQPLPDTQHGFPPNTTFATSGIDVVNLFNGNLVLNIPLGPDYPIAGGFTSQLHLVYNSQIWMTAYACTDINDKDWYGVFVRGYPQLGAGWRLDLGYTHFDPDPNGNSDPNFLTPDGSAHQMPSAQIAPDLSYLNFTHAGEVDYPSGIRGTLGLTVTSGQLEHGHSPHDFPAEGSYVTQNADRFGDYVKVGYVSGTNRIATIKHYRHGSPDTLLRTITFTYKSWTVTRGTPETTDTWTVLWKVSFPRNGGAQTVVFDYYNAGFYRSPYDTTVLGCSGTNVSPAFAYAPLLKTVQLDDSVAGSTYTFKYWDTDTGTPANGSLYELDLPTGGAVQYQYGSLTPPPPGTPAAPGGGSNCNPFDTACVAQFRRQNIVAISQRTEYPNGTGSGGNTWTYSRNRTFAGNPPVFTRSVTVTAPDQTTTVHYFHDEPDATADRLSNGLELETDVFDTSTDANPIRRLTYCYDDDDGHSNVCVNSTTFGALGKNIRESTRTTAVLTAGGAISKQKKVVRSGWDNYGHFGQEDSYDWAGANRRRGVATHWTANSTDWILNLYDQRAETQYASDGTTVESSVDRRFQFDTTTGLLLGTAVYDASARRVLLSCQWPDPASPADMKSEESATLDSRAAPPSPLCLSAIPTQDIGVNSDAFGKQHAYKNGQVTQTNWLKSTGSSNVSIGWFSFDADRADEDGVITTSRDPAGVVTNYSYDDLGRVIKVAPSPGAELATFICYDTDNQGATSYRSATVISPCPTTGVASLSGAAKTWERFKYDGFGRLLREIRQLDIGSFAVRKHGYDSMGRESSTSEWGSCGAVSSCETAGPFATVRSNYDPFGRPQTVTGPNNATYLAIDRTDGTGLYSDTLEVTTGCLNGTWNSTSCVDISGLGGVTHSSPQTTTKRDAFGRVTSVTDASSNTTSYTYDVNDKLTSVLQGAQTRTFTYDPFGFLRSESTPEKGIVNSSGMLANGSGMYGSLGNLREKDEAGGNIVSYLYDAAGRVACQFSGAIPASVKTCSDASLTNQKYAWNYYDGDGSGGGAYPEGKLTRRIGFNPLYQPLAPAGQVVQTIQEDFFYDGVGGRLSAKTTFMDTGAVNTSTEGWSYTNLGLVQTHGHPRVQIATSAPSSLTETYTYTLGWPTKITVAGTDYLNAALPTATITATYGPAGNLANYTAQQGTGSVLTTTITPDSSGLPRPRQIQSKWGPGATIVFDSLVMQYDASGNISKLGADFYTYDALSRLKHGALSGAGDQYFCYDQYGNRTAIGSTQPTCSATWSDNKVPPAATNYDSRGNQIKNGSESMSYDANNRLILDAPTSGSFAYLFSGSDERVTRVPVSSGSMGSTRRGIARNVVQAKMKATVGAWSLPTTNCTEATRRFTDVHCADPDWAYVEVFAAKGITSSCGSGAYCPETVLTRDQMAVFLLRIEHGGTYVPPSCTTNTPVPVPPLGDVPCPSTYANAIYQSFAEGLTSGCGGGNYCPSQAVNETSLAAFLNKAALGLQNYHGIQGGSFYALRDESNRMVTELQDSMPARDNVFLGNLVVASLINKTPTNSTPVWNLHGNDHLGTVRVTVNGIDGTRETHKYWPFGDEVGSPPGPAQRLSFAAMERDTESTHYYDHARTQDFGLGRFTVPDLLTANAGNPQNWNRYAFVRGNPVHFTDPSGLDLAEAYWGHQVILFDSKIVAAAQSAFRAIRSAGLPISVSFGFRTTAEQRLIYRNYVLGLGTAKMAAPPGTSRHESGFAIDFNGVGSLKSADRAHLNSIMAASGFRPLIGDTPHFQADPTKFGYSSLPSAIEVNQADYQDRFAGSTDEFGVPFDARSEPDVAGNADEQFFEYGFNPLTSPVSLSGFIDLQRVMIDGVSYAAR